jgi:hypothetical protein
MYMSRLSDRHISRCLRGANKWVADSGGELMERLGYQKKRM